MTTRTKTDSAKGLVPETAGNPKESKKAQLIRLLSTRVGADITTISRAFGWQPHTTRAAIAGLKKAGYDVTSEKPDPEKPTRYRISATPPAADAAHSAPKPAHAG